MDQEKPSFIEGVTIKWPKKKTGKDKNKGLWCYFYQYFLFKLFAFPSNPLTFGVPDKAYYRNTLCILLLISTFLLL